MCTSWGFGPGGGAEQHVEGQEIPPGPPLWVTVEPGQGISRHSLQLTKRKCWEETLLLGEGQH